MRIRVPEDFDFPWALGFLRARAIGGIESVDSGYHRSFDLDGRSHVLHLTATEGHVTAQVEPHANTQRVHELLRRMFDLDTDLAAFRTLAAGDAILGPLLQRRRAVRLLRFADPFEGLVRAILGQQVSLAAAATVAARLARLVGQRVEPTCAGITVAFPTPQAVAATPEQRLRQTGLTGAKTRALRTAAGAIVSGALDLHKLSAASGEEAEVALRSLPGIGPWTAAYVRMRGFGDADAFPASDLGVLKALRRLLGRPALTPAQAVTIAEAWRPWRAYATLHLWHSLADAP